MRFEVIKIKALICLIFLSLILFACDNHKSIKNKKTNRDSISKIEKADNKKYYNIQKESFKEILDFPNIKDTLKFISALKENCHLDDGQFEKVPEIIRAYQKIKIYGSDKDFIFFEYDFINGCMAAYPWKNQFIFTLDGKLVDILWGERYKFIRIFPKQNPFLLILETTGKGSGVHQIYKISNDTLENILDDFTDYFPKTYDDNPDRNMNEPYELKMKVSDYNKDGFNDIIFFGKIIYNKNGFDIMGSNYGNIKIPVKFIFIYNPKSGHFLEKEDYSKKYLYLAE